VRIYFILIAAVSLFLQSSLLSAEKRGEDFERRVYFAQRVPVKMDPQQVLPVHPKMKSKEVISIYAEKEIEREGFIHNGPWFLRPIEAEGVFTKNQMPKDLIPYNVWEMVEKKLDTSNAIVAIVNLQSYGTIAEAGYGAGSGKTAVYVLPDKKLTSEEIQDLWFVFQMALSTKTLWKSADIENIETFKEYGIFSLEDYEAFVREIVPNFLKK